LIIDNSLMPKSQLETLYSMKLNGMFGYLTGLIISIVVGCFSSVATYADERTIIVQSTTSTQNSGLFDIILPMFTRDSGIKVNVVAVGTGQALKNGQNGDGDLLLVHAKSAEEKFVAEGYGVKRYDVMYNDFVIVGPGSDPASIGSAKSAVEALIRIAATKSVFASRGDDSGTNKKEIQLWAKAAIDVKSSSGTWYRETGSGMGATLNVAAGMNAYTLTDRATWIAFKNKQNLKVVYQGDPELFNQYGIIMVSPIRHAHVKITAAQKFIDWITGSRGQAAIGSYRLDGKQLFFPNAK
jgi:tungstate transport system substrate-binding protein